MSYILNALRKSEQERQANRPETLTDQVLMPPPKSRKTAILIGALLAVNVLALLVLAWFMKSPGETAPARPQADVQKLQHTSARKPLPTAEKQADTETASGQAAKKAPAVAAPVREIISPLAAAPAAKAPSIEEMAAAKQAAEQSGTKQIPPQKSERGTQTVPPPAASSQRELLRKERQAKRNQPVPAVESLNGPERDSDAGKAEEAEKDDAPPGRQDIPLFKDLPYDFRSSVPKMTINVFVYDPKPEDRFVVLNMTKYKVGQTTKDSVEIREIRPNGVIASYGGRVFRIERP